MRHLFCVENIDRLQLAARGENVFFWPKNLDIWRRKVNFLYGNPVFCQQGISHIYPGLQLSRSDHPQKSFVSEQWVIFRGSPLFLDVSGHSPITSISTLNFGPFLTKLAGTVQAIKKWSRMTADPVRAGITEKPSFLRSAEKCFFFGWKCILTQKNTQNFFRDWYLFGKRQLFSLNNCFRSLPEHG